MILLTYGTRPEYIKIKPLIKEFKNFNIQFKILFTGQHKDIANGEYDFKLEMTDLSNNRLDSVMANLMTLSDDIFDGITHVLVQGDTTSVVGLSLAALHRKIKVIHLEAGLRTYDTENPFPEENNRRIVSTIATIHLCPTELNAKNLHKENVSENIFIVGNTVLDNLIDYKEKCEYTNKVLVTMHRRENHENIHEWFNVINELAKKHYELEFILPLHPNPNVQKHKSILTHVKIVEPLKHEELLDLLVKTRLVITDSGGIQEECSFFNKKCLVCRKVTERPESVNLTSFLINEPKDLVSIFNSHINDYSVNIESPYGDGKSSIKICNILIKLVK
jgi:UDP-N-acetylglucosamine 2-epimerase (non-hydrolysing)